MSAISQSRGAPHPDLTDYPRPPPGAPSGIKVIIVGAGIGGLACAIESRLEGHEVLILEQTKEFRPLGDNIGLFPNSGRLVKRWGIHYELSKACAYPDGLRYYRYDGDLITHQRHQRQGESLGEENPFKDAPLYDTTRYDLHEILIKRAKELGAELRMDARVTKYIEEADYAAVEVDGQVHKADVVLGADGVKSKARELVLGVYDAPKPSGYAIFRTSYSADLIRANPVCAHLAPENEDARSIWIGPDAHFIIGTTKSGKEMHWLLTHLDTADVSESWLYPGKVEDALSFVEGWDPVVRAVMETTPDGALVDWKLVFRDPLPTWVSKGGRTCVLGDAAHPFLPTSQQGASQAVEDGVTIAHALSLAKAKGLPLSVALRAYETLRYERVKRAQQLGVDNRERMHKVDWTKPIDAEAVKLPFALWLWQHDAIKHCHENFDAAVVAPLVKELSPPTSGMATPVDAFQPIAQPVASVAA
ncbi:hypothetical protein JCM10450v2_005530 [Rhodotorula kratochvilovae]